MPLRYTGRIIDHLTHDTYRPSDADELARQMRVPDEDRERFGLALEKLSAEKKVEITRDGRVRLPAFDDEITGSFRLTSRGFGFIVPDVPTRYGDLYVPLGNTANAISGDRVRASVLQRRERWQSRDDDRSPFIGRVVEVLERGHTRFAGTLVQRGRTWVVEPDGKALHAPVIIRDPFVKNSKAGDKVVIELTQYPEENMSAEGVIVETLGEAGRPDVETQAVIATHELRTEFPREVVDQARDAARHFEQQAKGPWKDREDLTNRFIFTIDPPDAKDFDDAISIEHDRKADEWTLGVHIADVGHFVPLDSPLDKEAALRGNSVYLPRLVIPMLPEALSNGVCSLQEGVPRFTLSAFITYDGTGAVLRQRVSRSVIKSAKRLTYLEAQALIDGNQKEARQQARTEPNYTDELMHALQLSDRLAKLLRARRRQDGMIVLALPEVDLVFDEDGHVIDAVPEDTSFTHTLIEMFMVEANEAVARTFADINVPLIRRIHPDPTYGAIEELRIYARLVNFKLPDEPSRKDLQALLEATREGPSTRAVHFAVLRTLSKASYSPALVGHFALASEHYSHFTSPIRRYPDLTVHRALHAYLDRTGNGAEPPRGRRRASFAQTLSEDARVLSEERLVEVGRHCSQTEVAAEEAERELRSFLVLQFLQENHMGDELEGVVTGMSGNGVFISIQRFLVDGMVKIADLPSGRGDRWVMHAATGRLVSQRSGASIGLGDLVKVKIAAIDLASRKMDLLVTALAASPTLSTSAPHRKAEGRGSHPSGKHFKGGRKPKSASGAKRGVKSRSKRRR
jgi:ribonuclease R